MTVPASRVVLSLLFVVSGVAAPVTAAVPPVMGMLTDEVHALDDCRADILALQQGMPLHVIFVRTTDGLTMDAYVDELLDVIDVGSSDADALFVVATEDRQYQLYVGERWVESISSDSLDAITERYVLPHLREGDWCAATQGAFEGLRAGAPATGADLVQTFARFFARFFARTDIPDALAIAAVRAVDPRFEGIDDHADALSRSAATFELTPLLAGSWIKVLPTFGESNRPDPRSDVPGWMDPGDRVVEVMLVADCETPVTDFPDVDPCRWRHSWLYRVTPGREVVPLYDTGSEDLSQP